MIAQPVLPQALGTGDSPQFAGVNIGAAADTTILRDSAGVISVEGKPVVLSLGTVSWSTLQTGTIGGTSYANGSAGLTGLPAETQVFVTDWQAWFIRNAAGTLWKVVYPTLIVADYTPQSGSTSGADQVIKSALVPAQILWACSRFVVRWLTGKSNASVETWSVYLHIGTANTTSDVAVQQSTAIAATARSMALAYEGRPTSTDKITTTGPASNTGWGGTATSAAYGISNTLAAGANTDAMYFSISIDMSGTAETPIANMLTVELLP